METVRCRELVKNFGKKQALGGLNISIEENKIVGLIGRNGAGKTTLLRAIAGHIRPTFGEVMVWGEPVFDNINVLNRLIYIQPALPFEETVRLGRLLELAGVYYPNWDGRQAENLIRHFELNPRSRYRQLSTGMKAQFNLILGLCSRAPLTLLDEPTLGQDAAVRKEFYSLLLRDYMEHPRTLIISSHLLSEIENMLEEVILIKEGRLVLQEPVQKLQEMAVFLNGKREVVENFIRERKAMHVEGFGNSLIAAVQNDLSAADRVYLTENHVDISRVGVEDLCIYLTRKEGGDSHEEIE